MGGFAEGLLHQHTEGAAVALLPGGAQFNSRRNPIAHPLPSQSGLEILESRRTRIDQAVIQGWNDEEVSTLPSLVRSPRAVVLRGPHLLSTPSERTAGRLADVDPGVLSPLPLLASRPRPKRSKRSP